MDSVSSNLCMRILPQSPLRLESYHGSTNELLPIGLGSALDQFMTFKGDFLNPRLQLWRNSRKFKILQFDGPKALGFEFKYQGSFTEVYQALLACTAEYCSMIKLH